MTKAWQPLGMAHRIHERPREADFYLSIRIFFSKAIGHSHRQQCICWSVEQSRAGTRFRVQHMSVNHMGSCRTIDFLLDISIKMHEC